MIELNSLRKAIISLEKAIKVADKKQSEVIKDNDELETIKAGVIQNFEFTYEQSWKLMKRWLDENIGSENIDGTSRKELFRIAAENKLISDVQQWIIFHNARNSTSHRYDEDAAEEVFKAAVTFLPVAKDLLSRLEKVR